MERDEKLAEELLRLERDVRLSLAGANRALADGLLPLIGSPLSVQDLSATTYGLRWRWQDQLAKLMRQYVRQLWRLAKRHQIPSVSAWIATQLRTFREVLEWGLRAEFGEEPTRLAARRPKPRGLEPITQGENGEPAFLAARARRPPRLRGELIIFRGDSQLRIPVVVSAHERFLESFVLKSVERKPRHGASSARGVSTLLPRTPLWVFQEHRLGWSIGSRRRLFEFPDLRGMTYLQALLRNPGVEISVEQLVESARPTTTPPVRDPDFEALGSGESGQELLDDQARREYQQRIKDLKRDAEIAKELGDTQRMEQIRAEYEFLDDQITGATAIRGRPRRFAASGDKLRVSVRKSTAKAIEVISQRMPDIGEHLKASISFGFKCCYRPVQQREWRF